MKKINSLLILLIFLFKFVYNMNEENKKHIHEEIGHKSIEFGSSDFFFYCLISLVLVLFAGAMSGLTVGYLSIDKKILEINLRNGTEEQKNYSKNIMPILENHHLLLTTLLLSNAVAMESLPIFLHKIVPATVAIILSTTFVLIFGEVIPQALCTGRNQLKIASYVAPYVKILIKILYIICYPISLCLDKILGTHSEEILKKKDLKALIEIQTNINNSKELLLPEERQLLTSIFELNDKLIDKNYKPINKIFMIDDNKVIDINYLKKIKNSNNNIIPVYKNGNKNEIIGLLKLKNLIIESEFINRKLKETNIKIINKIIFVPFNTNLLELLNIFKSKKINMAFVTDEVYNKKIDYYTSINLANNSNKNNKKILGIITMNKIFDNILKSEISRIDDNIRTYNENLVHNSRIDSHRSINLKNNFEEEELVELQEKKEKNLNEKFL